MHNEGEGTVNDLSQQGICVGLGVHGRTHLTGRLALIDRDGRRQTVDLPYMGPTVFRQIPLGKTGEDPIKFPAGLSRYGVQNQRAFPEPETPVTTVMACPGISTLS